MIRVWISEHFLIRKKVISIYRTGRKVLCNQQAVLGPRGRAPLRTEPAAHLPSRPETFRRVPIPLRDRLPAGAEKSGRRGRSQEKPQYGDDQYGRPQHQTGDPLHV